VVEDDNKLDLIWCWSVSVTATFCMFFLYLC